MIASTKNYARAPVRGLQSCGVGDRPADDLFHDEKPFQLPGFMKKIPPAGGGGTYGRRMMDARLTTTVGGPLVRSIRIRRTDGSGPELRLCWHSEKSGRSATAHIRPGVLFANDSAATLRRLRVRRRVGAAAGTRLRRLDGSVSFSPLAGRSGPIHQRGDTALRQIEHPSCFASREARANQLHEDVAGRNRESAAVPADRWTKASGW